VVLVLVRGFRRSLLGGGAPAAGRGAGTLNAGAPPAAAGAAELPVAAPLLPPEEVPGRLPAAAATAAPPLVLRGVAGTPAAMLRGVAATGRAKLPPATGRVLTVLPATLLAVLAGRLKPPALDGGRLLGAAAPAPSCPVPPAPAPVAAAVEALEGPVAKGRPPAMPLPGLLKPVAAAAAAAAAPAAAVAVARWSVARRGLAASCLGLRTAVPTSLTCRGPQQRRKGGDHMCATR
jgi:hypothetical protein